MTTLGIAGARPLASVTKTPPQMRGISSRWLLKLLPWVQTSGGRYRVNRRRMVKIEAGRVSFTGSGLEVAVIPQSLQQIPMFKGFDDVEVLTVIAEAMQLQTYNPGADIVEAGEPITAMMLIAKGKVEKLGTGEYGEEIVLDLLGGGDYIGDGASPGDDWEFGARAGTTVTILALSLDAWAELLQQFPPLQDHVDNYFAGLDAPVDEHGQHPILHSADHPLETLLDTTFVDYDPGPREYDLSVTQTVLRISTRVADLYNDPHNQTEHQLRLTIEAMREKQEMELLLNPDFGLLNNVDVGQRVFTESGPPTPDDFDRLMARVWKQPTAFLAHPKVIAAFGNECSRRGIYPAPTQFDGRSVPAWRGIPIFPCNKIPIGPNKTSSVLLMRMGEQNGGVVGLHQAGIPDEVEPSLSVRFMGIDNSSVISYLLSLYYSAAVLVPDAIAMLEDVQLGVPADAP